MWLMGKNPPWFYNQHTIREQVYTFSIKRHIKNMAVVFDSNDSWGGLWSLG